MKTNIGQHILTWLCAALALSSCSEETPEAFNPINGIYFNNRANLSATSALLDSTEVTFVYESGNEITVPVKIQLLGRPSAADRPITLVVTSDNATEGIDYTLPSQTILPAGETSLNYMVTLKRTEALKTQTKLIRLEIKANDSFSLPVTEEVQANGKAVSALRYRIFFSDRFTNPPAVWEAGLLGEFTQQKFELIVKVLNIAPADFNDASKMTLSKQLYINTEMNSYVKQETAKRDNGEPFDPDVLDKRTGEPLKY